MTQSLLWYSLIIFFSAVVGGGLVFVRKWSDDWLHLFISFGAGIFLGTVFLHLIPEAFHHEHTALSGLFLLIGFMLIFFIERFLFSKGTGDYDHSHKVISITALVGLSIHSIIAGFGLAVGDQFEGLGAMIFFSIIAHKSTAAFSLSSLFMLAKFSVRKRLGLLVLFALMTPLGALLFGPIFSNISEESLAPFLGLTAGTFLYVAVSELLPEVFHTKEKQYAKLALVIIGIIIMAFLGESH